MRGLWSPTFTSSAIRSDHAAPIALYASAFADSIGTESPVDILEAMSFITMRTATRMLLGENTEKQADEFSARTYEMLETRMRVTRHPLGIIPALLLNGDIFLRAPSRMRGTIAEVIDRPNGKDGKESNGSFLSRSRAIAIRRRDRVHPLGAHRQRRREPRRGDSYHVAPSVVDLPSSVEPAGGRRRGPRRDPRRLRAPRRRRGLGRAVRDLTFCRMLLLESMRLYPPLWILHRTPRRDYEACGHRFPGGRLINIPIYAIHRDPRNYERPSEFLPRRWEAKPPKGAYLPFGAGGPRLSARVSR